MPADEFSFDITPQDAIDYLKKRRKTELSWHWSDVQKQEHMRAFTVAKMTSATLLDDVRKSLDKAMAEGQSFQEWRKDIIPKLQGVWLGKTYGDLWDGMTPAEQAGKTPPTPEERDRVIKASRLETIFRTNMFNAYAAGRYRQLKEDADIYPYWRYVTAKDSAVRPAHRALEGKVFKADDPFWSTHYPPNGFNCRCIVEAVDEYDLEMQDLKVQEGGNTYFDEESSQTVYRDAEGKEYPCDKGWDYNVGEDTTGKKTLASKKFPPELTKAVREDLKAEAERLKAEAEELEKVRKQAEEESRRADAAQKAAAEAKKQAEAEAKRQAEEQRKAQAEAERKAEEQRKAQAEAERKAKEQSKKAETEQKRFVVDVTRPSKPSKHPAKKATTEEQKRFVVDVTRPNKPSKRPAKKAAEEQKRFVVDVTRPDKPSKRPGKKAATEEQKRFVVDITRPDKPSKRPGKKAAAEEQKRFVVDVTRPDKPSKRPGKKSLLNRAKGRKIGNLAEDIVRPASDSHDSDAIKLGNTYYSRDRLFIKPTCKAEELIREAQERQVSKLVAQQKAGYRNPLYPACLYDVCEIEVVDLRGVDTSDFSMDKFERALGGSALEHVLFYDDRGKLYFAVVGTESRIAIDRMKAAGYDITGLNYTHNHPNGFPILSIGDLRTLLQMYPSEARVFTNEGVLSFKPDYYKFKTLSPILFEAENNATLVRRHIEGPVSDSEYELLVSHERMKVLNNYGKVETAEF